MADRSAARIATIQQLLEDAGWTGELRVLPESTHTAAEAAAALGCVPGAIASSLVFIAGEEPLLVMTSGVHRVDTDLLSHTLGVPVRMARAKVVKEVTGQPIGGVSPIGHPAPLRTVVDESLQSHEVLWAAAGSRNSVFSIGCEELVRITGGSVARVATA